MAPARPRSPLASVSNNAPPLCPHHADNKAHEKTTAERNPTGDPADVDVNGMIIDKNPDQIRRMINTHIESGACKVGEFQRAIGVSSNGYLRFMHQSGPSKGLGCDAYINAWKYFKQREVAGIPPPRKTAGKKRKSDESETAADSGSKKQKNQDKGDDISDVHLDDEDEDKVPIFDTCTDVRRKISAHLRKEGVTTAGFCRDLSAQYHTDRSSGTIRASTLQTFRGKSKPMEGNTSPVYYAAYVFFEKLRIKEGKAKGKHRVEMEKRWPQGTHTNVDFHQRGIWAPNDSTFDWNNYGE
ncbi:MAG: hypothetical protein Q9159_006223 [Coniocarpon cinnabarinum]